METAYINRKAFYITVAYLILAFLYATALAYVVVSLLKPSKPSNVSDKQAIHAINHATGNSISNAVKILN